jgi:estrogen-related receptor beta like 1
MRPLNRHYFVLQTNPGEQFYLFTSLAAWLIRKTERQFDPPQEFDDPNSTIANILDNVRQIGVAIDFPPSKLKQVRPQYIYIYIYIHIYIYIYIYMCVYKRI